MAEFRTLVYLISAQEQVKLLSKYPVFASAELSVRAREEGAFEDQSTETGWYFTRTKGENGLVLLVGQCGGLISYNCGAKDTGLRVCLRLQYDEQSEVVQSCYPKRKKAIVWDPETKTRQKMSGKAPVVTFGGNEYVWLNKEECELRKDKTMELVSVELLCKAVQLDVNGLNNDYEQAVQLRQQAYTVATLKCTEKERAMLVPVVISDKDGYATATPDLEREETKPQTTVSQNTPNLTDGKGGQ